MNSNKFSSIVAALSICIFFMIAACGDKEPKPNPEDPLRISLDASSMVIIPGPEYDFTVSILSAIPARGVLINVEVKGEVNGILYYFSPTIVSSSKNTIIKLTNLPRQVICVSNVRVTSKGDNTNKTETNFKVVYK